MRDFDLGDVLSITTGALVSPHYMEGIYDILNYMTGDNLFTHQIPRTMRECRGPLLEQHPELAEVVVPDFDDRDGDIPAQVFGWLDEQKAIFGATLSVEPLATDAHERINPIEELCDMVGSDRVYVV